MTGWIPDEDWATIVRSVPIPSVDLVAVTDEGVVLAKRTNEPVSGEWFVPGGRIQKGESIAKAVHRVACEELGVKITIQERLGAFDHFYDVADVGGTDKHYVAHGFVVVPEASTFELDDQHADVRTFATMPDDLHKHVAAYLETADAVDF